MNDPNEDEKVTAARDLQREKLRLYGLDANTEIGRRAKFELGEYVTKPKRSVLDVLCDFYHCQPTLSDLVNFVVPWMQPRRYSIANAMGQGEAVGRALAARN